MPIKITAQAVNGLKPRATKFIEYDQEVKGFGVRVEPSGRKSFVLTYRTRTGMQRRITIGRHPEWSVAAARREAEELRVRISRGDDPLSDRNSTREAPTVADLVEDYITRHLPTKRPSSREDDMRIIRVHVLPALGKFKVADIDHKAVAALHSKITKRGTPTRANAVKRLLSKMFSLSIRWGYRTDNPCVGVVMNQEEHRERFLSPAEAVRLMKVLASDEDRESATVVMLALLTGARRNELVKATWDQFDLEVGIWTKPSSHTKQKRTHRVPLNPSAHELLVAWRKEMPHETLVFPTRAEMGIRAPWERIREQAGLSDVRFHDLRHSYASLLVNDGVELLTVGKLLGHTQAQTTMRYAHLADETLRTATARVTKLVTSGK